MAKKKKPKLPSEILAELDQLREESLNELYVYVCARRNAEHEKDHVEREAKYQSMIDTLRKEGIFNAAVKKTSFTVEIPVKMFLSYYGRKPKEEIVVFPDDNEYEFVDKIIKMIKKNHKDGLKEIVAQLKELDKRVAKMAKENGWDITDALDAIYDESDMPLMNY